LVNVRHHYCQTEVLLAHIHPVAVYCPDVLAASNADFSCLEGVYTAVHTPGFGLGIVETDIDKVQRK